MKVWQRRVIGILGVGGGAIGIAAVTSVVAQQHNPIEWLFSLIFAALYAWGLWCGVRMLEGSPDAERKNLIFWLVQVPVFSSPVLGYFFANGFHLTVSVQASPLNFNANFFLGSTFTYSLLQSDKPWILGVNLFALGVALWLVRVMRRLPPNNSSKPTPLRGAA
ncbi:hypothetical protein DWG18_02450 [Lysobacter sp. TY2-98]|uniref:hypothetical protein n=1 Tax=Lysobacter sp. TY2-98 TaxID=2290922 RepID=UPI000E1FCF90|nr:hypothetical protein [Lysobacter sp. TY2-98]AXK71260.1 hypothetical protein DWG18_02450 [Lysobacter sp. TY2-98]